MSNVTTIPIEIVDKATGHVSIMHFVTEERHESIVAWSREATDEKIEAEITKSGKTLANVSWRRIGLIDIPSGRLFRNAWRSDGRKIAVDMSVARVEHMNAIRRARNAKLAAKDDEWMREFSRGNQAAAQRIEIERQTLRDIPQIIDADVRAAPTPEKLAAVWPEELKGRRRVA